MISLRSCATQLSVVLFAIVSVQRPTLATTQGEAMVMNKFKNWSVYKGPNNVYFIASKPEAQSGTYSKREEPLLIISDFPEKQGQEVSVYIGYTCKSGAPVRGTVEMSYSDASNKKTFTMHSSGERAWVKGNEDQEVINLFKKGARVRIQAESFKNTNSTDTYSLDGFSDAHRALSEARKNDQ